MLEAILFICEGPVKVKSHNALHLTSAVQFSKIDLLV